MGDPRITADGGQPGGTDRIEAIAAELEALGPLLREQAIEEVARGDVQLPDEAAPSQREFDDHDAYLRAAHAWVVEELLDAASDLEHRTLELQQAVELYPGLGADRAEAADHRDVVREDLADVASALDRLVRAGAQLARIEAAYDGA